MTYNGGGGLSRDDMQRIKSGVDRIADAVRSKLQERSIHPSASPILAPIWSAAFGMHRDGYLAAFFRSTGGGRMRAEVNFGNDRLSLEEFCKWVTQEFAVPIETGIAFGLDDRLSEDLVQKLAIDHVNQIESQIKFAKLGDIQGMEHLEDPLRTFISEHPDYERNVFVMMRFMSTPQMNSIFDTVKKSFASHGYIALRADEKAYTDELWSNIEVYIAGCGLGVAIFEDIEQRDFNPNVAYELGFMKAKRKRCLILKEKRLPRLPSDVIHRLYREFDVFDIEGTVSKQVNEWIQRDL